MFHLIWSGIVGFVAGFAAFVSHLFMRPKRGMLFHPAGIIFSTLGAFLVMSLCTKLNLSLPA